MAFRLGTSPRLPQLVLPHGVRYRGKGIAIQQTRFSVASQPWKTARIESVGRTLLRIAADVDRSTLSRCVDFAIANRLISVERVLADIDAMQQQRLAGRTMLIAELAMRSDGRVRYRSQNERRVAGWLEQLGVVGGRPDFVVATAIGDVELDFAWPDQMVTLEVSPFHTHGSEAKQRRDMQRRRAISKIGWSSVEAGDADIAHLLAFTPTATSILRLIDESNASGVTRTHPRRVSDSRALGDG